MLGMMLGNSPPESDRGRPPILLAAEGLAKIYRRRAGRAIKALDGIDLEIPAASIYALAGASGGGKSTLARCLALLEQPTSGEIRFEGLRLSALAARHRAALRPQIQLIFQDPAAAINPRFSALEAVAEPLVVRLGGRDRLAWRGDARRRIDQRARELLREVALPAELNGRSSLELSGGQRQRVAIARALAAEPRLIIFDEGLAALDLSHQARIANLLLALQERYALTYLLISHDLRLLAHLADEIAVLDHGHIVERGAPRELLGRPRHHATRALVGALPGGAIS